MEVPVIARVWHGYTTPENADTYEAMLKPELLPGVSQVPGYNSRCLLRREAGAEVEFMTIILSDSIEAIRALTVPDETAVIPRGHPRRAPKALVAARRQVSALPGCLDSRPQDNPTLSGDVLTSLERSAAIQRSPWPLAL